MDMLVDYTPLGLLLKAHNQAIDAVFYDVSALTFQEWLSLNPMTDRKGKIIVVPPGDSPGRTIRHYESAEEFLQSAEWINVVAIAVAGVGSSVIGTAALARNVADACHGDVAGVMDVMEILTDRVKLPPPIEAARQGGENRVAMERRNRLASAFAVNADSHAAVFRALATSN